MLVSAGGVSAVTGGVATWVDDWRDGRGVAKGVKTDDVLERELGVLSLALPCQRVNGRQ